MNIFKKINDLHNATESRNLEEVKYLPEHYLTNFKMVILFH